MSPDIATARVLRRDDSDRRPVEVAELAELQAPAGRRGATNMAGAIQETFADARRIGYADGHAEGSQAAREEHHRAVAELRGQVASALSALDAAQTELAQRQAVSVADIEQQVIAASMELVEAVLAREIVAATDPGRDALVRALALVPPRADVVCRLNPEDLGILGDLGALEMGRSVELLPDPTVERGGAVVEAGASTVDAQLGPAVERVKRELSR